MLKPITLIVATSLLTTPQVAKQMDVIRQTSELNRIETQITIGKQVDKLNKIVKEEPKQEEPKLNEPKVQTAEEPANETITVQIPTTDTTQAPLSAQSAFEKLVAEYGLSRDEKNAWAYIIDRESSWNHTATNPVSGAYGLAQALPAGKMATHGNDYLTNPETQLRWMYDYMTDANRYGGIMEAYNFWITNHWY